MDGSIRTERVVLLGLVTLLGATVTVVTAVAALAISAAAALVVCGIGRILRPSEKVSDAVRWSVLLTVGFGISWILGPLASYVAPVPERAVLFLQLSGVAPIVYYGVARRDGAGSDGDARVDSLRSWVLFGVILLGTGLVREVFGRGTILGYLIITGYAIPADFMGSPVGAFLMAGAIVLAARLLPGQRIDAEGGVHE